jgi:hypothetical protein
MTLTKASNSIIDGKRGKYCAPGRPSFLQLHILSCRKETGSSHIFPERKQAILKCRRLYGLFLETVLGLYFYFVPIHPIQPKDTVKGGMTQHVFSLAWLIFK